MSQTSFFRSLLGRSSGLMILLSVVLHSAIALFPLSPPPKLPEQAVLLPPPILVTRLPERSPVAVPNSTETRPIALPPPIDPPPSIEPQPIKPQPIKPQPIKPQPIEPQPAPQIVIPQPVVPDPAPLPVVAEPPSDTSREISSENEPDESIPDGNGAIGNEENPSSPQFNEAEVAAMAAVWEGFLGSLQGGLSGSNLQQILSVFGQPEQEELFFDANQQPKFSVVSHHLLEGKTPRQVFEEIVNPGLNDQEGFEVRAYGEFADGPVYEVVQGEIVHYLNIVPLNVDSVLIVSERPPGA